MDVHYIPADSMESAVGEAFSFCSHKSSCNVTYHKATSSAGKQCTLLSGSISNCVVGEKETITLSTLSESVLSSVMLPDDSVYTKGFVMATNNDELLMTERTIQGKIGSKIFPYNNTTDTFSDAEDYVVPSDVQTGEIQVVPLSLTDYNVAAADVPDSKLHTFATTLSSKIPDQSNLVKNVEINSKIVDFTHLNDIYVMKVTYPS